MPRPMGWFRSNSGKFAWVAFFALACQFALTFGHLHLSNIGVISAALTAPADSTHGSTGAPSSPAPQTPTPVAQDFCAVCNNINLANTLLLPVSPRPLRRRRLFGTYGGRWRGLRSLQA